jgi:hypothetical protein
MTEKPKYPLSLGSLSLSLSLWGEKIFAISGSSGSKEEDKMLANNQVTFKILFLVTKQVTSECTS